MKLLRFLRALPLALMLMAAPAKATEQSSFVIPDTGPHTMADMVDTYFNPAFRAIAACSWGTSAPANGPGPAPIKYQCWADTTTNPVVMKIYDGASWVITGKLDATAHTWTPEYQGTDTGTASTSTTGTSGHTLGFLDGANTFSGVQSFNDGTLGLKGSSSGTGTIKAPAAASTFVWTMPAATDTLLAAAFAQTVTNKTINCANNTCTIRIASDVTGLGTGVATALGVNVGSAGAPVLFNGAGGTPSSMTATNVTGLPGNGGLTGQVPIANGGTAQSTAAGARASSGLNVDSFTGHGDSTYTILATDRTVGTNASFTASRTWTLPAANAVNAGQEIIIADFQGTVTGTNTLVISRAGSDTINGGTSVTISVGNGAYMLKSDGSSKWTAQALGATATTGVSSVGGVTGAVGVANGLEISGSNIQVSAARRTAPTTSVVTIGAHSGGFGANTSGTYTTPSNVLWIEGWITGAGAGGGSGNQTSAGGNGNASCWNTTGAACSTPVYSAGGGSGGTGGVTTATTGGAGGAISGSSACDMAMVGQGGEGGQVNTASVNSSGGRGGNSFLGGGAVSNSSGGAPSAAADSGSGGSGGAQGSTVAQSGGGGGAGATCYFRINAPAGTYTYAVGTKGTGNVSPGTGGASGGNGGDGRITVIEHYGT